MEGRVGGRKAANMAPRMEDRKFGSAPVHLEVGAFFVLRLSVLIFIGVVIAQQTGLEIF